MKNYKLILILLFFSINFYGQNEFQIGSVAPDYTTVTPYRGYYHDARYQVIYLKSELENPTIGTGIGAGDEITNFSVHVKEKHSTQAYSGFTIKFAHTSASSFSSSAWLSGTWTTVYSGNYTINGTGWNSHTFTQNFVWNGTDNIVIEFCFDNSSYSQSDYIDRTSGGSNMVAYAEQDGATGCSLSFEHTGAYRPVVKFNYNILPIELSSAKIDCYNENTIIEWTSQSEINNDYYTIEKSTNTIDYKLVDYVKGSGNSNKILNYSYTDYEKNSELTYYKLSQTDFDGKTQELTVLNSKCNDLKNKNLSIENINVIGNNIDVSFVSNTEEKYTISILNMLGQIVSEYSNISAIGNNNAKLKIQKQKSSIYLVVINTKHKKISKKFVYSE